MKERPILFNGDMVRAILDGRKTQTRRLVPVWQLPKHYPDNTENPRYTWMATAQRHRRWGYGVFGETEEACAKELSEMAPCPFGSAGNRLWVRETFGTQVRRDALGGTGEFRVYRASDPGAVNYTTACGKAVPVKWKPSLHMPRKACRIVLEITAVRVERLTDISEEDAKAEGVGSATWFAANGVPEDKWESLGEHGALQSSHINRFATLWESIYGAESWQANPWCWVIEFKRVESHV